MPFGPKFAYIFSKITLTNVLYELLIFLPCVSVRVGVGDEEEVSSAGKQNISAISLQQSL